MKKIFAGLIGLLSLVSVANATALTTRNTLFGAELAIPSISYSCAMPAEGVAIPRSEMGNEMGMRPDSYCEQDPGNDTPEYATAQDWWLTHSVPTCPSGSTMATTCRDNILNNYQKLINLHWRKYRQAVCKCWADWPDDADQTDRDQCLATALTNWNNDFAMDVSLATSMITSMCCVGDQ